MFSRQVQEDLHNTNSRHLPARTYEQSDDFQDTFNRDITACLRRSRHYVFKGTSAKYVPARVSACPNQLQRIRVITLDPRDKVGLRHRATDRHRHARHRSHSVEWLITQACDEIHMALVALFDIRDHCDAGIEIVLSAETAVTRVEMFDSAAFISWYQSPKSAAYAFPETWKFERESVPYSMADLEIARRFEYAGQNVIRFASSHDEAYLLKVLGEVAETEVTLADVQRLRDEYAEFIVAFEQKIRGM